MKEVKKESELTFWHFIPSLVSLALFCVKLFIFPELTWYEVLLPLGIYFIPMLMVASFLIVVFALIFPVVVIGLVSLVCAFVACLPYLFFDFLKQKFSSKKKLED